MAACLCESYSFPTKFGLDNPQLGIRDGEDEVTMLDVGADGSYPEMEAGHSYMVLSEDDLRELDDPLAGGARFDSRDEYIQWVMQMQMRQQTLLQNRRLLIQREYRPIHAELYGQNAAYFGGAMEEQMLHPELCAFIRKLRADFGVSVAEDTEEGSKVRFPDSSSHQYQALCKSIEQYVGPSMAHSVSPGLRSFPMLRPEFCAKLLEELMHYDQSGLPQSQPNSMNQYGLILDEIGLSRLIQYLRRNVLAPFFSVLFDRDGGSSLDHHHSFIVQYEASGSSGDKDLGLHYDASHVTFNVCLGVPGFRGGQLFFCGLLDQPETHEESVVVEHEVGRVVVHAGRHRHGAKPLEEGRRVNLIVWCKSSQKEEEEQQQQHGHSHDHSHEHGHSHDHGDCCDDDDEGEDVVHLNHHNHNHDHHHHGHGHGEVYEAEVHESEVANVQFQIINLNEE